MPSVRFTCKMFLPFHSQIFLFSFRITGAYEHFLALESPSSNQNAVSISNDLPKECGDSNESVASDSRTPILVSFSAAITFAENHTIKKEMDEVTSSPVDNLFQPDCNTGLDSKMFELPSFAPIKKEDITNDQQETRDSPGLNVDEILKNYIDLVDNNTDTEDALTPVDNQRGNGIGSKDLSIGSELGTIGIDIQTDTYGLFVANSRKRKHENDETENQMRKEKLYQQQKFRISNTMKQNYAFRKNYLENEPPLKRYLCRSPLKRYIDRPIYIHKYDYGKIFVSSKKLG